MTRRLVGIVGCALVVLAGGWLVLAPFALGTQPADADWVDATLVDVWTGLGLVVVGLVGIVAFAAALRQHLVERGLVVRPQRAAAEPQPEEAAAPHGELDALVAPLVAALTEDMARERRTQNGSAEWSHREQEVPR